MTDNDTILIHIYTGKLALARWLEDTTLYEGGKCTEAPKVISLRRYQRNIKLC